MENQKITINATVYAPIDKIWKYWTEPEHIKKWNSAMESWHTTKAENDLRVGGKFNSRMEAKDGSAGFDFYGIYDEIIPNKYIEYTLGDERKVKIDFDTKGEITEITMVFEAETENSLELQREGWQNILNNYKKYVEEKI